MQRGMGYRTAFVHSVTYVTAEPRGGPCRVDVVGQGVHGNEVRTAVAEELDAVQLPDAVGRLPQNLRIHRDVVPWVEIEPLEPEIDLVGADDSLVAQEGQIHRVERRAVCDEDATLPAVSFAQQRKRSEEHTPELQSLMRISYAVF